MTNSSMPASIRNRNPGAMYPGAIAKRWGATEFEVLKSRDGEHKIATFGDPTAGAAALFDLLCNAKSGGVYLYRGKPLRAAIATWCGGYYVDTYLGVIGKRAGIAPGDVLDVEFLRDPHRAIPLAAAMAWQEAGRTFPLSGDDWAAAHALAVERMPEAPARPIQASRPVPVEDLHAEAADPSPPAWSPDNDMPSPRPETRSAVDVGASRKWRLLTRARTWMASLGIGTTGLTVAEATDAAPGVVSAAKAFLADNAMMIVVAGLLAALIVIEIVRFCIRDDVASGRYVASGDDR